MRTADVLILEATIGAVAPGGDGVALAELNGERRAVFVPRTAAGDRARLEVDPSHRPARGRVLELLASGNDRVASACAWADRCGGCDWMHLSLDAQARIHVDHLRGALPPAWRDVGIQWAPATRGLAYRTRARIHVRCQANGRAVVGMHEARTRDPVEVDECVVLEPPLEAARRRLPRVFEGSSGQGDVQLALGTGGLPVLHVRWAGNLTANVFGRLERATSAGQFAGAQLMVEGSTRPARIGDPTPWTTGPDGSPLRLASGGFGQANESANAALARHVGEFAGARRADRAVELYAGSGNLSVILARGVHSLICVEENREACTAARANLAVRGLEARVVEADADAYAWSPATKLVVLDPPRTGARSVAERLAASRVPYALYVSCDAQTLGRDLAILESAYAATSFAAFEMFPQTSHVETVVALERRTR
jgi:23S rRNA (uracil1939-C5)-methyltransferase